MARPWFFFALFRVLVLYYCSSYQYFLVSAQYIQTYSKQGYSTGDGSIGRYWRPRDKAAWQEVYDVTPDIVFLEYNCALMTAICRNVRDFFDSPRGKKRSPQTLFVADFNTGKSGFRNNERRSLVCPENWVKKAGCPHSDQEPVFRQDGKWWTTALEPGTIKQLANEHLANGGIKESKMIYSCDEFPPASWIEGGDGTGISGGDLDLQGKANTRCAAMRCMGNGKGVKAEQNWQATAHNNLGSELRHLIKRRKDQNSQAFPGYDKKQSVALFYFRQTHDSTSGIAARVISYTAVSHDDHDELAVDRERITKQAKRGGVNNKTFEEWADSVTMEEIMATNNYRERLVFANDSLPEFRTVGQILLANSTGSILFGNGTSDTNMTRDPRHNITSMLPLSISPRDDTRTRSLHAENSVPQKAAASKLYPLLSNATSLELEKARKIVEAAIIASSRLNAARLAKPLRNNYKLKPGTIARAQRQRVKRSASMVPPILQITEEIAEAAALVSEADATDSIKNSTFATKRAAIRSGTYWMEHLVRKGTVPWGNDPDYKIFRNVVEYGAVGDGVTDDTKAIKAAMNDGKRCGEKCNGSTTKNAIVYFPPGKYRVSSAIEMPFGTQVIGDANERPTIVAAKNFIGLGVLSTDKYTGAGVGIDGGDQEWFVNTANFYRQIRNIRIDITATRSAQQVACLHYQVAQATSIQNVELIATAGTGQRGIFAENGSGGVMSDITFTGGGFGIYGGNQQFTAQRLTFNGCDVGVQVIWDWGWVWKSITMNNVKTGFYLFQDKKATKRAGKGGGNGNIGSVSVIDSSFKNVETAVLIAPLDSKPGSGSTGVIIENVAFQSVGRAVADTSGTTLLEPSSKVEHWALGPVYSSKGDRSFSMGKKITGFQRQSSLLDSNGNYFERPKPQYEERPLSDFIHVKDFGAKGDGVTDDTAAIQSALYANQGKILFIDAGSYIITKTITVPVGTRIVGETWSQLVASGPYFQDASNPKVMLQVGTKHDIGGIEMQDLIFTSKGPAAGLILVEWNVQADSPGAAALWDCHARIGGATGTDLTPKECPPVTTGVNQACNAASLLMHITREASGYFENMWLWVADHMIDDPNLDDANNDMVQTSIYVARGLLIESRSPVWLYGTASEHSVFYQYNFNHAQKVFAGMIQSESPYYQPTPEPPAPFQGAVGLFDGDPEYKCASGDELQGCDASWGVIIRRSRDIFVAGAGIYSWFSTYMQNCIDQHACQKALVLLNENYENVRIQHLITIGAKYSVVQDGVGISSADNLNVESHPRWSQISVLDVKRSGPGYVDLIWIDPQIWEMETPSFTCLPPCTVKIPPWTGATRVINYPLVTVSSGSWTSTITKAPLTVTNVVFEPVTIKAAQAGIGKRQAFGEFWPKPATTSGWPQIWFTGPDGEATLTGPPGSIPTPPPSIGPDAAPPHQGNWPKRAIVAVAGDSNKPTVGRCHYFDMDCIAKPWEYKREIDNNKVKDEPDDDGGYSEDEDEKDSACAAVTTSSSSTIATTSPAKPTKQPEPSPRIGEPRLNKKACYNSGYGMFHNQMDEIIDRFCGEIYNAGDRVYDSFARTYHYNFHISAGMFHNVQSVDVDVSLDIKRGCAWINRDVSTNGLQGRSASTDLCSRYLHAIVDGCNCSGVDGKQGGVLSNDCYSWRLDPNEPDSGYKGPRDEL